MKTNANTRIHGKCVILVPYETKHVSIYHEWMKSEELQLLTASEPLTLEEEYEMQRSWREDDHKCTFILLSEQLYRQTGNDEIASMVGDVNLFFNDPDNLTSAEVEIMIAESEVRGQGLGKEGLLTMMRYGIEKLNITQYTAKIGLDNTPSLTMFDRLGFTEVSRSEAFKEVTLELPITPEVSRSEAFKEVTLELPITPEVMATIMTATPLYSIDIYPT